MSLLLQTSQISKKIKDKSILNFINLNIEAGSIYGLLGSDGSGKSTLLKIISGVLSMDAGSVFYKGDLFDRGDLDEMGTMLSEPMLYKHLHALDNLRLFALLSGYSPSKKRLSELLDLVRISENIRKKKVKTYSDEDLQRLGIAIALISDPKLLILDDPFKNMSSGSIIALRDTLKDLQQKGMTIIIATNLLYEVKKTCDYVGIIDNGWMKFEGSIEDLYALGESVERSYLNLINS